MVSSPFTDSFLAHPFSLSAVLNLASVFALVVMGVAASKWLGPLIEGDAHPSKKIRIGESASHRLDLTRRNLFLPLRAGSPVPEEEGETRGVCNSTFLHARPNYHE
jgi:hypothetical protein